MPVQFGLPSFDDGIVQWQDMPHEIQLRVKRTRRACRRHAQLCAPGHRIRGRGSFFARWRSTIGLLGWKGGSAIRLTGPRGGESQIAVLLSMFVVCPADQAQLVMNRLRLCRIIGPLRRRHVSFPRDRLVARFSKREAMVVQQRADSKYQQIARTDQAAVKVESQDPFAHMSPRCFPIDLRVIDANVMRIGKLNFANPCRNSTGATVADTLSRYETLAGRR